MLKAIAIDDEPVALKVIQNHLEKIQFIELKGTFTDVFEAMNFMQEQTIELIFLDIHMPDLNGIEFARSLAQPPMIIFTTAYSEHAVKGFELNAIDYLLKPFSLSRFLKACNKALAQYQLQNQKIENSSIFIKSGYEQIRVNLSEILYIEGLGNYVKFILRDQQIASRLTMKQALNMLPEGEFIRIHRSYIVAKRHITKIRKTDIFIGDAEIPVGEGYKESLGELSG